MEGSRDALKDISFDGHPSGYRDFRRNTLSPEGFLTVIKALDEHYKFLPETEMHESIDEFLFALKRRNGEGATAFASRFRTQLSRVETLICQERELTRVKRRRTTASHQRPVNEMLDSEMEETDRSEPESHARAATGSVHSAPAAAGTAPAPAGDAPPAGRVPTAGTASAPAAEAAAEAEHAETATARSHASGSVGKRSGKQHSRGTFEQDWAQAQVRMKQMLGTLKMGHLKPKPIFPQSSLGHLFMRKYGLSREQRAQVVRSTNGSSRFVDIERILRASDFEESSKPDHRRSAKPPRREIHAVQDQVFAAEASDSSSVGLMDTDDSAGSDDALAVDKDRSSDEDVQHEIEEVYELQRKAKDKFKKSYCNYKDAKKRVRELKRGRSQPAQVPLQKSSFKYDKKPQNKNVSEGKKEGSRPPKREDAHVAEATMLTSFNNMIEEVATCSSSSQADVSMSPEEVLSASVPEGHAILDTGCPTSVVGSETARRLAPFLGSQDLPPPEERELPPVELKGFKGEKVQTTKGLRWNVKLGDRWGTVTTCVIPGGNASLSRVDPVGIALFVHRPESDQVRAELQEWLGAYKGINLSKIAETYPTKFCNVVSSVIAQDVEHVNLPNASATDHVAIAEVLASSDMPVDAPESSPSDDKPADVEQETATRARQIVTKLHINTGHASPEQMMRLANRCRSSESIKRAIRQFECSVCKELKLPTLRRNAAMPHADQPNQIVGVDYVQVELTRDEENADASGQGGAGREEIKFNVLTCVDYATDFAQQIIAPTTGKDILSKAFHQART
eukprot:s345_g27.t1